MPKDWSRTGAQAWSNIHTVESDEYRCGYCSNDVASKDGWTTSPAGAIIRICPQCNSPTFFTATNEQWPGPKVGVSVAELPPDVEALYEQARSSVTVSAFTGAVMLCRKILMHVAVGKGAKEDQTFAWYVQWLLDEHYVPRGSEGWVDYIRARGNDANHEIVPMNKEDAAGVLRFTRALLSNVYELPADVPKVVEQGSDTSGS